MEPTAIREQISLYYAGRLNDAGVRQLLEALQLADTAALEAVYPLEEWQAVADAALPAAVIEAALQKHKQLRPVRRVSPVWWSAAAAVAAMVAGLSWYFIKVQQSAATVAATTYRTITVPEGKRSRIALPDGSTMLAAGGTSIRLPEPFGVNTREVQLDEGEVFFDISRDESKSFTVHTNGMDVAVLGTSFNVRHYKAEKHSIVSVRTGKVSVTTPHQPQLYLTAGAQSELDMNAGTLVQTVADTTAVFGWMEHRYVFRNAPLGKIINQLKHSYPVQFNVQNKALLEKRFSATFHHNTIAEIMEQLKLMNGIHYSIDQNTITIK